MNSHSPRRAALTSSMLALLCWASFGASTFVGSTSAQAANLTSPSAVLPAAIAPPSMAPPRGASRAPAASDAAEPPDAAASAPLSLSARKVYQQARSQLVQIRTVLKGRASQTSVGSGFFVSTEGHIITNFHVAAEAALQPERHDLVYVTADGREAPLQILQLDVLHDLALLKAVDAAPLIAAVSAAS